MKNNVLHLLSWTPTEENPTLGNFCLHHIEAAGQVSHAVLLTVYCHASVAKQKIETIENENYTHIKVSIPRFSSPFPFLNKQLNKYRIFKAYNFGFQYIKKNLFSPNLLHLHVALPLGKMALYWKKKYNLPYILTEHWSIYLPEDNRLGKNKISQELLQICNNAVAITSVSTHLQQNMQQCGVKNTFYLIPNVVDTAVFSPEEKTFFEKKQILHVSSLVDFEKNFSGILRVIKKVRALRDDFVLNVVHDAVIAEFEQYVSENNLSDTVIFHGKKDKQSLARCYNNADFLLLFSHFETFSCVVMEALSCGKPAVATHTGAIPEMLAENRGIVIPPNDEKELFNAILHLLDHHQDYNSTAIRQYAVENFSENKVSEMFLTVYRNVLKGE